MDPLDDPLLTRIRLDVAVSFGMICGVIVLGLIPLLLRDTKTAARVEISIRIIGAALVLAMFYFVVPYYKKLFADYGIRLGDGTRALIQFSDLVVMYWYGMIPGVAAALILDGMLFSSLHKTEATRGRARVLSIIGTALNVAVLLWCACSLAAPLLTVFRFKP